MDFIKAAAFYFCSLYYTAPFLTQLEFKIHEINLKDKNKTVEHIIHCCTKVPFLNEDKQLATSTWTYWLPTTLTMSSVHQVGGLFSRNGYNVARWLSFQLAYFYSYVDDVSASSSLRNTLLHRKKEKFDCFASNIELKWMNQKRKYRTENKWKLRHNQMEFDITTELGQM